MDVNQLQALSRLMESMQTALVEEGFTLMSTITVVPNTVDDKPPLVVKIKIDLHDDDDDGSWHLEATWE